MPDALFLIALGFGASAFGTLVGAGGGFVMVPVLAILRPDLQTASLTAISLAVVAVNGISGTFAYARSGRIDYRSALPFAAAALPGSVAGALLTRAVDRSTFDFVFAGLLIALAAYLVLRRKPAPRTDIRGSARELVDRDGVRYAWRVNVPLGVTVSVLVGVLSSLFGIGGGIIHVPALIGLLGFPAHVATATSQLVLAIVSTSGSATHLVSGHLDGFVRETVLLSVGAVAGAQLGARVSGRVSAKVIVRGLAAALAIAGARLAWQALG